MRAAWLGIGALLLAGCSTGPTVVGTCDRPAIEDEIHHILMDSGYQTATLERLVCEGDWAYAIATLEGPAVETSQDGFLLRRDLDVWILKAPESACVDDDVPPTVRDEACSAPA